MCSRLSKRPCDKAMLIYSCLLAISTCGITTAAPTLLSATVNAPTVRAYGLFELTPDLRTHYTNPFDPGQIDVGADFTSPAGRITHVNGFWWQGYVRTQDDKGNEVLTESGAPSWKIRFAPNAPGKWRYTVSATDASGTTRLNPTSLIVTKSNNPGFVGVSKRNPRGFAFAGEKPYFAIGQDMAWATRSNNRQTFDYDHWLSKMGASGGNWARIWSIPWRNGLEWTDEGPEKGLGYRGLGAYNLINAWRLDRIFDDAQANGVYCMLTIGYQGETTTKPDFWSSNNYWQQNPYNASNGGPCATAADLWANPTARKFYRQRLRYIAARYGWRTNIQSWEFWNEVDAPPAWIREMAQYMKGTGPFKGCPGDPYGHLVTTTFGNDEVWRIPELDFTQIHVYGNGSFNDLVPTVAHDAWSFATYDKPHIVAEYGIDWSKGDGAYDPDGKGVNMHGGIWCASAAGDAGTAMEWYWDYIDPKDLYGQYTPIAKLATTIAWTAGKWSIVDVDPVTIGSGAIRKMDMTLPALAGFYKMPTTDFTVQPQDSLWPHTAKPPAHTGRYDHGTWQNLFFPQYLFSPAKQDLRTRVVFHVDYPESGKFIVHIDKVSLSANLRFLLDGKEDTVFKFDYQGVVDKDCGIDVPAGQHAIELDNSAGDWVSVKEYRLTNYSFANVHAVGIAHERNALLWLQNSTRNWKNVFDKKTGTDLRSVQTHVHGLPIGVYSVDIIDTVTGNTISSSREVCSPKDGLPVKVAQLKTDVAVRIRASETRNLFCR